MFDYDAELSRYNARLRAAAEVRTGDRVLDIGCGTGQTTREAGRSAGTGSALGVDLSGPMVNRARQLSVKEGIRNVSFERADAQIHPFAPERFTLGISRFGTMFFTDPVAAFANIGSALRPGRGWFSWCGRPTTARSGSVRSDRRWPVDGGSRLGSVMTPSRWRIRPSRPAW